MFILDSVVSCGGIQNIPAVLPGLVSLIITLIKIAVPIMLVIWGMLDLAKAMIQQKDEEIKKGQKTLLNRVIAAIIVFLVVALVQFVIGLLGGAGGNVGENPLGCFECFVNNRCN